MLNKVKSRFSGKKVIIALTAVVAMVSCKKEDVTTTAVTVAPTVTKSLAKFSRVYDNGTPETVNYTYDAQGRIATIKNDNRTETFDFVSATSLVVTERFNSNNNLATTKECTMNEKGYVTKIVVKNSVGTLQGTYDYNYNADGYSTNYKVTYPSGSTMEFVYVITDGNAVSSKLYYDNVLSNRDEITYDNTKTNKTQIGIAYYWPVPNLFGKCTKNMMAESKTYDAAGTLTWHTQSTYDMDAVGYPTKQTINFILQGKQGVNTFTYQ
jgi:hypothetical protein